MGERERESRQIEFEARRGAHLHAFQHRLRVVDALLDLRLSLGVACEVARNKGEGGAVEAKSAANSTLVGRARHHPLWQDLLAASHRACSDAHARELARRLELGAHKDNDGNVAAHVRRANATDMQRVARLAAQGLAQR